MSVKQHFSLQKLNQYPAITLVIKILGDAKSYVIYILLPHLFYNSSIRGAHVTINSYVFNMQTCKHLGLSQLQTTDAQDSYLLTNGTSKGHGATIVSPRTGVALGHLLTIFSPLTSIIDLKQTQHQIFSYSAPLLSITHIIEE